MADHGTLTAGPTVPAAPTGVIEGYNVPLTTINYGSLTTAVVNLIKPTYAVSDYRIAGTVNIPDCPPPPGPPTDGQVWPLTVVEG